MLIVRTTVFIKSFSLREKDTPPGIEAVDRVGDHRDVGR